MRFFRSNQRSEESKTKQRKNKKYPKDFTPNKLNANQKRNSSETKFKT